MGGRQLPTEQHAPIDGDGGESNVAYRRLRGPLEALESALVEATNEYAQAIQRGHTALVVRWCEELGDANYKFCLLHGEDE